MRRWLPLVLLAACGSPEPPATVPVSALPSLDDPPAELTPEEKRLDPPRVRVTALQYVQEREMEGRLDRALALLRYHWQRHPDSVDINAVLGEVHCRIVESLDLQKTDEKPRHEKHRNAGKQHVREAIRLDAKHGPAHYWYGHLLLHSADAERSYALLKQALAEFEEANRLAPGYDYAGSLRMMGRIYQETPGWPMLGSVKKAIECYEASLKAAPGFLQTHLWLGEAHLANKQKDKAREQFEAVVAGRPRPGLAKEDGEHQTKAKEQLDKLK
jgi:tetratricopeptide (TPR) repeat protein